MAKLEDLLPEDVRRALADLAAPRQPATTDEVSEHALERAEDRAGGECHDQRWRHPASSPPLNHHARHSQDERRYRSPRACVNVIVKRHARERARERFPGFKAARIVDEVHAALTAGRVSALKPHGLTGGDFPYGLYAWTEDGDRIYGIMHGEDCFAVHTTMRRGVPA
jgi:hypothetical protein